MTTHSVDDLLVKDMQNQQAPVQAIPNPPPAVEAPVSQAENVNRGTIENTETPESTNKESQPDTNLSQQDSVPNVAQDATKDVNPNLATKDAKIDEYGNPIEPPRTYTEDEVQRMIRDRLSRGRNAEQPQPTPAHVQKVAEDFKADPNSEESWEGQLNTFIDKRLETRQAQLKQQEWQQQEGQRQAEFEAKFNSGMSKYQDFEAVVSRAAPAITPTMMMATRSLDNPAAFVYAAAKLHPGELDRISRIGDALSQAAEVGRLHERMVKHRGVTSAAPKPLEVIKGDLPNKAIHPERSLDQRIFDYAKQKRR